MNIKSDILERIKKNNGYITTKDVLDMGHSKTLLSRYEKAGILYRPIKGIYFLTGIHDYDSTCLRLSRLPHVVYSLESAFHYEGLAEAPELKHVTIPSNTMLNDELRKYVRVNYIKPELHSIGIKERKISYDIILRFYDAERTLCDYVRLRKPLGKERLMKAIKCYLSNEQPDYEKLRKYANDFQLTDWLKYYVLDFNKRRYRLTDASADAKERFEKNRKDLVQFVRELP